MMFQDREVHTMYVQGTNKKLNGLRDFHRLDQTVESNRKVALIADICPVHPDVSGLMAIDLNFLHPNTTYVTQPIDQGVIQSLKNKYRAKVFHKYINAIDSNKKLLNITILDTIIMLKQSWSTLPDTTSINCFKKAGISIQSQLSSTQDTDNPFAELNEFRALNLDLAPDDYTSETFIATDEEKATSIQSLPIQEELLHQFTIGNNSNDDVEMIDDESDEMELTGKK